MAQLVQVTQQKPAQLQKRIHSGVGGAHGARQQISAAGNLHRSRTSLILARTHRASPRQVSTDISFSPSLSLPSFPYVYVPP